jgi:hypothetical protein
MIMMGKHEKPATLPKPKPLEPKAPPPPKHEGKQKD